MKYKVGDKVTIVDTSYHYHPLYAIGEITEVSEFFNVVVVKGKRQHLQDYQITPVSSDETVNDYEI